MPQIEREEIFKLINNCNWIQLFDILKINENYIQIMEDSILASMMENLFINELIIDSLPNNAPTIKYLLEQFYILHKSSNHNFRLNDENYKKLVIRIAELQDNIEYAYKYALLFPDERICHEIIEKYNKEQPKLINHTQKNNIKVSENKDISKVNATISLFKSNQEFQFYKAVRECFPTYHVYPNVALNAIVDFNLISSSLTAEEKKYFWKALIDCVIIDSDKDYKPFMCFELDSCFHDTEKQIEQDRLKDSILAKAGQKLLRIRHSSRKDKEKDFIKLIKEIIIA